MSVSTGKREAALLVLETTSCLGNGAPRWLQRILKEEVALVQGSLTRPGRLGTREKTTLTPGNSVDKSQVIILLEATKRTEPESS